MEKVLSLEYPAYKQNPVHSSVNNVRVDLADMEKRNLLTLPVVKIKERPWQLYT